jgi:carboxypeptidase family protein/sigma-70-like protein
VLALDEPYRSTLVLRFFEEQPADAIARAVGVPVETVRTRVKRGLAQLRAKLGGEFEREGESLVDGLALLLARSSFGARAGGGGGAGVKAWTAAGAGIGAGVVVMSGGTKIVIAATTAALVLVAAWRLMPSRTEAPPRSTATRKADAALPPAACVPAPAVAAATRVTDEPPAAAAAADASAGDERTYSFDGRVVDETGAAVSGATVLLADATVYWASDRKWTASLASRLFDWEAKPESLAGHATRSASDGTFRFEGIDAFQASVVAAVHETAGVGLVSAPARKSAAPIVVTLTPMAIVRGHVTDIHGDVPKEARIDVGESWGDSYTMGGDIPLRPDGSFRWFAVGVKWATFRAVADDGRKSESVRFDFGPGQPLQRTADFVLGAPIGACRGRIVATSGEPLDLNARLLPRLLEWERGKDGERSVRLYALSGTTSVPARFRFDRTVGFGTVDFAGAAYSISLPPEAHWIVLVARDHVIGSAEVPAGGATANGPDLVVDLAQMPAAPSRTQIEVRILDAKGRAPWSGASAQIELDSSIQDPDDPSSTSSHSTGPSRQEDATATFWFDGVEPGHCTITIKIEGIATIVRALDVVAREKPYEIEVVARPADAELHGLVLDPEGKPLAKAHVRLRERTAAGLDDVNVPPTVTNDEGRFRFEKLASSEGVVIVHALPFAPAVVPVKLTADGDAGTIALAAGGRVAVNVTRSRSPTQSSWSDVHAFRTADSIPLAEPGFEGSIDWKTATRLELVLPAGRATIDVTLIDGTRFHKEVDVVVGKTQELTIE